MPSSPASTASRIVLLFGSPLIFMALSGLLTENVQAHQRNNVAYASVAALKSYMARPAGFRVENVRVTDAGAACIQFHARDAGGSVSRAQAVVVDGAVAESESQDGRFEKAWNRQCRGPAYDVTGAVRYFF
jgi:hypothetical protein